MRKLIIITGLPGSGKSKEAMMMQINRPTYQVIDEAHRNWERVERELEAGHGVIAVLPGEYDIRHIQM